MRQKSLPSKLYAVLLCLLTAFGCLTGYAADNSPKALSLDDVPVPERLYFVDYQDSYGVAENDGNGIFKFKYVLPSNSRYPYYGFSTSANPRYASLVLGTQPYVEDGPKLNVNVELDTPYDFAVGAFESIDTPAGAFVIRTTTKRYDIILDWNTQKVTFKDFVPEAPETLWLVNYNTNYGSAQRQPGNVYKFEGVAVSSIYKDYGFADNADPNNATFICSAVAAADATKDNCVQPEFGVEYPWAFTNQPMLNDEKGAFILPKGTYDITFDWDNQTVTFEMLPPAPLHVIAYAKSFATAEADENGIYTFEKVYLNSDFKHYGFSYTNPAIYNNIPVWVLEPYAYTATAPNVTPESGTEYNLVFSTYDAVDNYHGAFYFEDEGYYDIVLDWKNLKVTFTKAVGPAPERLWVVNYSTNYGSAEKGEGDIFRWEDVHLDSGYRDYAFANSYDSSSAKILLSAVGKDEATGNNCVNVVLGETYPLFQTTWDNINAQKGAFAITEGNYDITLDWNAQTVTFSKPAIKAPNKLYFVSYNSSYRVANKGENNIYVFEDVTAGDQYPYYGICPANHPNSSEWAILPDMTGISTTNLRPELGTEYPVVFGDPGSMTSEKNSFEISAAPVDITFDWDNMTVTFTQKPKAMPETLWLARGSNKLGSAQCVDGVFTFKEVNLSAFTVDNEQTFGFYDNETVSECNAIIGASIANMNVTLSLNTPTPWVFVNAAMITTKPGGFHSPTGIYDVVLDWNAQTVTLKAPALPTAPAKLWIVDDSKGYASASNEGGIYKFYGVTLDNSRYPYYGFANNADPKVASLVLSATDAGSATSANNVNVVLNETYPVFRSTYQTIYDMVGAFKAPVSTYDIILDYNNATVVFKKPGVAAPETIYVSDNYLDNIYGSKENNGSDIFEVNIDYTEPTHIIAFTSSDDLRNASGATMYYGSLGAPVTAELGVAYDIAPSDYDVVWNNNTGFKLPRGLYHAVIDFNEGTVVFTSTEYKEIKDASEIENHSHGTKLAIGRDWAVIHKLGDALYVYDHTNPHADHVGHSIKVTTDESLGEILPGALLSDIEAEVTVNGDSKHLHITNCTVKPDAHSLKLVDVAVDIQTTKTYGDWDYTEFQYLEQMKEHQIVNLRGLGFSFSADAAGKQFAGLFNSLEVSQYEDAIPMYVRFEWAGELGGNFSKNAYNVIGIVGPVYEGPAEAPARANYVGDKIFNDRVIYALAINPYDGEEGTTAVERVIADKDAPEAWYNIQGIRVEQPSPGNTYIRVANGVATKVLVK